MKKYVGLIGLWIAVLIGISAIGYSAQTCQRTDLQCYELGAPGNLQTPFRVDSSGNITSLGSETLSGNQTWTGITVMTPQVVTGVSTTTTITPTATYIQVISSGAIVTIGGARTDGVASYYVPLATASATAGQLVILYSTSSASYVQISTGALTGASNGTWGSATSLSTAPPKILEFIFDAVDSVWREVHN